MEDPHYSVATNILDRAVEEIIKLLTEVGDWDPVDEQEGISSSKLANEDGNVVVKTTARLNKPINEVFAFLWDFNNKKTTDQNLVEIRLVKSLEENIRILYEQNKGSWPVSNRDFVYAQRYIQRPDGILIHSKSIEGILPETPDVIRGDMIFNGIYLKRVSDTVTEMIGTGSADLKGSLPSIAKNKIAERQIYKVIAVKRALGL